MENIPLYVSVVFVLTTLLTLYFFYKASGSKLITGIVVAWLAIHSILGLSGFYTHTEGLPPRFILLLGPPLLVIIVMFLLPRGRMVLDRLDERWLTWLNVVRIPVEIVLLLLFVNDMIPRLMTFEGRNFDILSGISAPFIAYFGYNKHKLNKTVLLIWNLICLGLLVNIVVNAILAAPFPFQQFAFDQPNRGILYFPFIWLPAFIVPAVLLSHLVNIRQLVRR